MFIAALFKVSKTWRQPRCFSVSEWVTKRINCNTQNGKLFSTKGNDLSCMSQKDTEKL